MKNVERIQKGIAAVFEGHPDTAPSDAKPGKGCAEKRQPTKRPSAERGETSNQARKKATYYVSEEIIKMVKLVAVHWDITCSDLAEEALRDVIAKYSKRGKIRFESEMSIQKRATAENA